MFAASKINDTPRININTVHGVMNETSNGITKSFIQPKITSTPLMRRESIFATPPKSHLLSPRRYSLSEIATPTRTSKRDSTTVQNIGPLLASTRYNINVSTYEDTKSPGLAGRIVQYNEESERERERQRPPTHQAKYGSPGLFPVVHLFKKDLPTLAQKPRRVTIRIASPEYSRQHSQEYNRKLLEGIVKPNSPTNSRRLFTLPGGDANSSTKSILDALKESTRKRIHANEEYEQNEDSGKRLRTEQFNGSESNKRTRADSPLSDTSQSPSKPTSKRICMYDEYAASCSSMDFSFNKSNLPRPKRKSINISTLTEIPKESKQVKLINAETQTITNESKEVLEQKEDIAQEVDQNKSQSKDSKLDKKKESPVKVFDDAPLERIRKNRLAALMGSLTGRDPILTPKPDYATKLTSSLETPEVGDSTTSEISKSTDKPLISILSTPKKASPHKSNKHVHFSIPESTSQTNLNSAPLTSFAPTQSYTSITSPISSASETQITFVANKSNAKLETPAPPSSPVDNSMTTTTPAITFGTSSSISSSTTSIGSKESSSVSLGVDNSKTDFTVPSFQFKPTPSSTGLVHTTSSLTFGSASPSVTAFSSAMVNPPFTTTSPPKPGGFKFNLNKPVSSTTAINSAPTFSFGSTSESNPSTKSNLILGNAIANTNLESAKTTLGTVPGSFSFGAASTNTVSSTSNTSITSPSVGGTFGNNTPASSLGIQATTKPPASTFKFGSNNNDGSKTTNSIFFGTGSTTTSTPTFGTNTSAAPLASSDTSLTASAFSTSKPPAYPFGSLNASSNFGVPSTTSTSVTFGAPSAAPSSSVFGAPTTATAPVTFGAPANSSNFGAPTTTSASTAFGTPLATSASNSFAAPSTSANTGFGSPAVPMFGSNKPVPAFGATTSATPAFGTSSVTNSSLFGKNNVPAFGQNTTQSAFGTPTTTTSSSVFGPNSASSSFGAKTGGFGAPSSNTNIFGGVANTQASVIDLTNSKPAFGVATPSPFGNLTAVTTAPSFGNSTTPAFNFGAKTTASSSFAAGNAFGTTTTTASTGFGTTATPSFNTSNSFGSGSSNLGSGSAFGNTSTSFGTATTTTTQSGGFGSTNTPSFGGNNTGFSTANKSSVFGNSSVNTFGSGVASSFGTTTSTSGFGSSSMSSGFGTTPAASAFSKPQPTQNAFGSTSNAFGPNNFPATQSQNSGFGTAATTQSGVFSFGSGAAQNPTSVFSFGGVAPSSETPKPAFNFTGGNSATPAFGNSNTLFGSTGAPAFGGTAPQFNSQPSSASSMFSIGSGTSSGRARSQLKAKRRT